MNNNSQKKWKRSIVYEKNIHLPVVKKILAYNMRAFLTIKLVNMKRNNNA